MATTISTAKLAQVAYDKCATLKISGNAYSAWLNICHACMHDTLEETLAELNPLATSPSIPKSRKVIYSRAIQALTTEE